MSALLKRLKKNTKIQAEVLSKSKYFNHEQSPTQIPLLNVALSGKFDGGISAGITMVAGESKTFKTGFLIQMVLAHQLKYKDSVCLFYDAEFSPVDYWEKAGVNMDQVLHLPIKTVEEMRNDCAQQLDSITEEDNVIIIIDSIGGLASAKEANDALEDKMTADMTRARALNSFFRIVTPHLNMKNIPMVLINSFYDTMEMYSKRVYAGGKKCYLSSDDVWFISRATDKDGKDVIGYNFTITADKSRTVKEGSKFPINVTWKDGIDRYSGIFQLAVEAGIIQQSGAWYTLTDLDTGQASDKKAQRKTIVSDLVYMESLLKCERLIEYTKNKYLM